MDRDRLRIPRILLVVALIAVPGFGVLTLYVDPTLDPDFPARLTIAGLAAVLLVGSYRLPWVQARLRGLMMALAAYVFGYFALRAGHMNLSTGHAVALMLIAAMTVMLAQSWLEVFAFWGFAMGATWVAHVRAEAPQMDLVLLLAVVTTVIGGIGSLSLVRWRLEQALRTSRAELDERVHQRTAELNREVEVRRAAEATALRASQAKSRFLANMSHELRTPLNAIVGYTELVQEELEEQGRAELAGDLQPVRTSADHLLRMLSDVLDLARIEAGQLELVVTDVDVPELLAEVTRVVEPVRRRTSATLVVQADEALVVHTDKDRLTQIALNLVTNALKFSEGGTVTVTASQDGGGLQLAVSDTGLGIAEEDLERIFERFAQVDDSTTRRHDGTGLGLALCRDLAARLGGRLTVASELGVGSTFTFELPNP